MVATGLETGTCENEYINLLTYKNTYIFLLEQARILCATKVECN